MIDCRRAAELTSHEHDRPLARGERVALWLHRLFCPPCRLYQRQLEALQRLARRYGAVGGADTPGERATPRLDDAARARLRAGLRAARGEDDDPGRT
ncbi:MAG: hypothetical protein RLW62_16730 [Gammaproteobacteria bacterium]